jgi:hypothetical protein
MVISQNQTAGRSHNTKTDNKFFEWGGAFKMFGTTLVNQKL